MPKTPLENRLDEVNDTIQDIIDDCNEILDDKHITRIESLADIPETLGNMSGGGSSSISSVDTTQGLGTRQVVDPETGDTTQQAFAKVDGTTIKFNSNGQMQADIKTPDFIVVAELPIASAQTMGDIYLVPSTSSKTKNVKDEFITIEDNGTYEWEQIGTTAIDLSNYYTKQEIATVGTTGDYDDLLNKPTIPPGVVVDSAISSTSENPVQNKVIEQYLEPVLGSPADPSATIVNFITSDGNLPPTYDFAAEEYTYVINSVNQFANRYPSQTDEPIVRNELGIKLTSGNLNNVILTLNVYSQKMILQAKTNDNSTTQLVGSWLSKWYKLNGATPTTSSNSGNINTTINGSNFTTIATISTSDGYTYILSNHIKYIPELTIGNIIFEETVPEWKISATFNGTIPPNPWQNINNRVTVLEGNTITVDTELSTTSTNPVQNKVIRNFLSPVFGTPIDTSTTLYSLATSDTNPPPVTPGSIVIPCRWVNGTSGGWIEVHFTDYSKVSDLKAVMFDTDPGGTVDGHRHISLIGKCTATPDTFIDSAKLYTSTGTEAGNIGIVNVYPNNYTSDQYMVVADFNYISILYRDPYIGSGSLYSQIGNNAIVTVAEVGTTFRYGAYTYNEFSALQFDDGEHRYVWNGVLDESVPWNSVVEKVTTLESRENIRTYFDTTTNDLYITNDGSDPTPSNS